MAASGPGMGPWALGNFTSRYRRDLRAPMELGWFGNIYNICVYIYI